MFAGQRLTGLKFDEHRIIDNQVGPKYPDDLAAKANWDRNLGLGQQTRMPQSEPHRLSVNRLQKARTQLVIDLKENANDPLSQIVMLALDWSVIGARRCHRC